MLILEERGVKIERETDLRAARGEDGEETARSFSHPAPQARPRQALSAHLLLPSPPPRCVQKMTTSAPTHALAPPSATEGCAGLLCGVRRVISACHEPFSGVKQERHQIKSRNSD